MKSALTMLAAACLLLAGCSDEQTARRVLAANGLHDIRITGYRWLGCAKDEAYSTGFSATTTGGETITGVVCSGWGKGATVRFD